VSRRSREEIDQEVEMTARPVSLLVALALLFAAAAAAASAAVGNATQSSGRAAPRGTKTIVLQASSSAWKDTGINVRTGKHVRIVITKNNATCHAGGASDCPIGKSAGILCSNDPVVGPVPAGPGGPTIPYGTWMGRIGHGKPFAITYSASQAGPGELYLAYNDCTGALAYSDNAGSATFRLTWVRQR
jgi:hypothetical protein